MGRAHYEGYGIVLKTAPWGEGHRLLTLFTGQEGLVRAVVFGAMSRKNLSRGFLSSYVAGSLSLTYSSMKDGWRLEEGEVLESFETVRTDLEKFYTASLWAEVVLLSQGGGEDAQPLFDLLLSALRTLDKTQRNAATISIQFLWRYLGINGVQPSLGECTRCCRTISAEESLHYGGGGSLLCARCLPVETIYESLTGGGRSYLKTTETLSLARTMNVRPSRSSLERGYACLRSLVQDFLGRALLTLETGQGILLP